MSSSNSRFSISISNTWSDCSISRAKSHSCNGSPSLPDVDCSDESTTYMGVVSSIYTCCAPCCTYWSCASISCLCSSCSFRSWSFNSWNSLSVSSILLFSFSLCVIHLSHCCLFASIRKASFSTTGSTRNLQLFSSSMRSTIFLLPLPCAGMLTSAAYGTSALRDAASCYFTNHFTTKPTSSLSLAEL